MDTKIALEKIKATEKQASAIFEQANQEARDIIAAANTEKERLLKEARVSAQQQAKELLKDSIVAAQKKIDALNGKLKEEIIILKESTDRHIDQAVDFLRNKIGL